MTEECRQTGAMILQWSKPGIKERPTHSLYLNIVNMAMTTQCSMVSLKTQILKQQHKIMLAFRASC